MVMDKKVEIKVLKAESPEELSEKLSEAIEEYWEPIGGPFVAPFSPDHPTYESPYRWKDDEKSILQVEFCLMVRRTLLKPYR